MGWEVSWTVNSHSQAEIEALLLCAVKDFLDGNHGATLVRTETTYAIVATPGLNRSQVRGHLLACALTLGAWVPVFAMIAILRVPTTVLIHIDDQGNMWSWELDERAE